MFKRIFLLHFYTLLVRVEFIQLNCHVRTQTQIRTCLKAISREMKSPHDRDEIREMYSSFE